MTEGYIQFGKYKTYYRIVGENYSNPPIILLHGGPGSTHNYMETLDGVSDILKCPLISYDQLGCGNSYIDGHEELWKMDTWIEELKNLLQKLNIREYYLLGQSFGGMLTLEFTCNYSHPGLKGIILSSTLPSSKMWGEEGLRMVNDLPSVYKDAIARAMEKDDYQDKLYLEAVELYMKLHCSGNEYNDKFECLTRKKKSGTLAYITAWGPNEFMPKGNLLSYDVCDKLKDIDIPVMIFSGGRDLSTPYINKYMYDHIPGAKWHLFQSSRHMCFVECNEEYQKRLADFILETRKN